MAKFVVDRRTWYRGHESDESRLLRKNGDRCCIGFVAQQVGCSDEQVLDMADIAAINVDEIIAKFPVWMRDMSETQLAYRRSTAIGAAYSTNDDSEISDAEREAKLKAIFAEHGDEIEFIN